MRFCSLALLAFLSFSSCSDPDCPPSEDKVGHECRAKVDTPSDNEPGEQSDTHASTKPDASTVREQDASRTNGDEHDAGGEPAADREEPPPQRDAAVRTSDPVDGSVTRTDGSAPSSPADAAGSDENAAVCGNGKVENGEDCDGNCPNECPEDDDPCTKALMTGTGCNRTCGTVPVAEKAVDGCCVKGERYSDDRACTCGNGYYEAPEQCDDSNANNGDGCSADCTLENLTRTPGDDGVAVLCGGASCKQGWQCIVKQDGFSPYTCAFIKASGAPGTEYAECDGPEDCFHADVCAASLNPNAYWMKCTPKSAFLMSDAASYAFSCHADVDCERAQKCVSSDRLDGYGVCSANM